MGCKFCKNINGEKTIEISINQCDKDKVLWSSEKIPIDFNLESWNSHNTVKNSKPFHLKSTIDNGKQIKKATKNEVSTLYKVSNDTIVLRKSMTTRESKIKPQEVSLINSIIEEEKNENISKDFKENTKMDFLVA